MTTQKEALTLALEALEICETHGYIPVRLTRESITAIKEALAQPDDTAKLYEELRSIIDGGSESFTHEDAVQYLKDRFAQTEQEPVAWMRHDGARVTTAIDRKNYPDYETRYSIPLYTTPPQRTWVGLTDEEAHELWESTDSDDDWELMKRTEAKLKEKNT